MKSIFLSMMMVVLIPAIHYAGTVYGSVTFNASPVSDAPIKIVGQGKTISGKTKSDGSFKYYLTKRGRYVIYITFNNQTLQRTIYSSSRARRYDFVIVYVNGRYYLRRQ